MSCHSCVRLSGPLSAFKYTLNPRISYLLSSDPSSQPETAVTQIRAVDDDDCASICRTVALRIRKRSQVIASDCCHWSEMSWSNFSLAFHMTNEPTLLRISRPLYLI